MMEHKISTSAELGVIIKNERKSQKMTQANAAGFSGVGIRFLSELETGKEMAELGKVLTVLNGLKIGISLNSDRKNASSKTARR
jgi:HTH-type transcriptional regulator / antitoxin HipB